MKKIFNTLLVLVVLVTILLSSCVTTPPQALLQTPSQTFLSLVLKTQPESSFCVENEDANWGDIADWYQGECLKTSVHWGKVDQEGWGYFEDKGAVASAPKIVSAKGVPLYIGITSTCAAIPRYAWSTYADFVYKLLKTYPHIIALEMMNEPDTASDWAQYYLGCWGDTYETGVYYGEFVNYVYSILKPQFPHVAFWGGAFIDPFDQFANGAVDTIQADGISFHYYPWCSEDYAIRFFEIVNYLHQRTSLPLIFSETSLLYPDSNAAVCELVQADYVIFLQNRPEVVFVVWYTLGGRETPWRNSDLWDSAGNIKPSGEAYLYSMQKTFVKEKNNEQTLSPR